MDTHLNIFKFFNADKREFLEDNLSRGFALCLKYDDLFLEKVLRKLLTSEQYEKAFSTNFPDHKIEIDLQTRVDQLENIDTIIGVACGGEEIHEIESTVSRDTSSPKTDVSVRIKNVCLIFEFKRTNENCSAQLNRQVDRIKENCASAVDTRVDLSWSKIIEILLSVSSLRKQISNGNAFTSDFLSFLESFPADWSLIARQLSDIPFSVDVESPNFRLLNNRLDRIKFEVGDGEVVEYIGRYRRIAIKVDYRWINEINSGPVISEGQNYIDIGMHFGDTKGQGFHFFKHKPVGVEWPQEILGYRTEILPYLKISDAYGSALFWIEPTVEESRTTHAKDFFSKFAGKWNLDQWDEFEKVMGTHIEGWKEKCTVRDLPEHSAWNEQLVNTQRTLFLLSVGTHLRVFVPYNECQELDDKAEPPTIVGRFKAIISEIKRIIDEN